MNVENEKCVVVVDENLLLGIIANTAAILGITMGMIFHRDVKSMRQRSKQNGAIPKRIKSTNKRILLKMEAVIARLQTTC